jgi:LemA protein
MKKIFWIILAVIVVIGLWFFGVYNGLVSANEKVNSQWAQIETQYQRRVDLIPNLVNSVKGVMKQEQSIFASLAEARTKYGGAITVDDKVKASNELEQGLGRLIAVMENYPQLKSADNVQTLMVQLEGTENRISVERKNYNDLVKDFNVKIKVIPTKWVAGMLGYSDKEYFQTDKGAEVAPKVEL